MVGNGLVECIGVIGGRVAAQIVGFVVYHAHLSVLVDAQHIDKAV